MSDQKQPIVNLLKSIETGEPGPLAIVNADRYKQHNLSVGDGLAGLGAALQAAPKGSLKGDTVRVFQDGDHVFAHSSYNFFGPKIGFDIFRFEDGKVVEHWDNLQETPTAPNSSGRSMTDGPTVATELDQTQNNKALVRAFVSEVLVAGKGDRLGHYIDADNYTQHNPAVGDGVPSLVAALQAMAQAGTPMTYTQLHTVLGEGNFVLAVSEGQMLGKLVAFYDLFRVANGKIVEHWDTIESIPVPADWKNQNGKFGF